MPSLQHHCQADSHHFAVNETAFWHVLSVMELCDLMNARGFMGGIVLPEQ